MVFLGFGNNLTTHGRRSSSPHSTALLSNVLSTVSTLLTVFGPRFDSASFGRCTYGESLNDRGSTDETGIIHSITFDAVQVTV